MMNRQEEVRSLLAISEDEVIDRAGERLVLGEDLVELHLHFAQEVVAQIRAASEEDRPCRLILPVGPTGGYPHLIRLIRDEHIDLSHCWFFFMDEYAVGGRAVPPTHPLSFKGVMEQLFFGPLGSEGGLRREQVFFPDEGNIDALAGRISDLGGLDACLGGVGIHGHVAFNEPESGVANSGPRLVELNGYTVTINAVRGAVGGNLECFPREAYTLGMNEILGARRIVLYVRNGCEFDWANTVLRLALFGTPGDDYPVTHIRGRNYTIVTDRQTLRTPANQL